MSIGGKKSEEIILMSTCRVVRGAGRLRFGRSSAEQHDEGGAA